MVGIVAWAVIVLAIISVGIYYAAIGIKKSFLDSTEIFKYKLNIDKEGFKASHIPLVKVLFSGKEHHFLIDTGATNSVISQSVLAKDLSNYKVVDSIQILGIGGSKSNSLPIIEEVIEVESDKLTSRFVVVDSWEQSRAHIKDVTGIEVSGLLGSDFFEKARWIIDLNDLVIWKKN